MARNWAAFLACGLPLSAAFFHSAPLLALPAHSRCFAQRAPTAAGRRWLGLRGARAEIAELDSVPFFQLQTDRGPVPELPEEWQKGGVYACFNKEGQMQYVAMSRKVAVSMRNHLQVVPPLECWSAKAAVFDAPTKEDLEGTATAWIQACLAIDGDPPRGNTKEVEVWRLKASEVRRTKPNVYFSPGGREEDAAGQIKDIVRKFPVVLFIKGSRDAPLCGFSDATINMLNNLGADYETVDTLDNENNPAIRETLKTFSQWPTIPQLYVGGEFMGGADVAREMFDSGELKEVLAEAAGKRVVAAGSFVTLMPEEVQARMAKDPRITYVDVRTQPEFDHARVPGSVNIPAFLDTARGREPCRQAFVDAFLEANPDLEQEVVLGCQAAIRTKQACSWVKELGYKSVIEVEGGFGLWVSRGLPIETVSRRSMDV